MEFHESSELILEKTVPSEFVLFRVIDKVTKDLFSKYLLKGVYEPPFERTCTA